MDADNDTLHEVLFSGGGFFSDYEQNSLSELPTSLRFTHRQFYGPNGAGQTGIFVGSLDSDDLADFLYVGTEVDSTDTTRSIVKEYVAEYDPQLNNFRRVSGQHLHSDLGGFAVRDFDLDGRIEIVSSSLFGNVYVVENSSDNQYQLTWQDSLPFVNQYYATGGDVDGDGNPEFFVGAITDGYYLTMYEADRDNHYVPKIIIRFLSGDLFPNNYCIDVDGDGRVELVTMVGRNLFILKPNGDNSYYVWYLKRENIKEAFNLYDFNGDGKKDFIISKTEQNQFGQLRLWSDVYVSAIVSDVKEEARLPESFALRVFPNPFNPRVTITFELQQRAVVSLTIFDTNGKTVTKLLEATGQQAGKQSIAWEPRNLSSGIYFIQLRTGTTSATTKTILIR